MAAENGLIKKADLARAREIDFVYRFEDGIKKLIEALGITRKIPKTAGTNLKAYKATGTLLDGLVAEGDIIPLSHYKTVPVNFAEITIKKWRKATSAEAIVEKGYDQAVQMTTDEMLKDVQKGIKKNFFSFLASGTGLASGTTFQDTIAQIWGQLQVLYEDTEMEAVYFMNQLDAASYLGSAPITMQTAFGMTYIEDFLGLGTVIFNSSVPKGTIYGTAKENIVLYYVPVNGADLENAFEFTSDELGYIGIHETPDYDNITSKDTVMCGMVLFAERLDGIVKGSIGGTITPTITTDVDTITIPVGGMDTVHAKVAPAGTAYTWASADTDVVTVANGLSNADVVITGVAAGTVNITCTAGSVTKTVAVTVSASA
jgi:hypothetical protein